jgi:hypothetical protein
MNDRAQSLHSYLTDAHSETWKVLMGLRAEDLEVPLYMQAEPGWKVRDAVAHLADAEHGLLGQVRRLVAGQQTVPEDFDLNRWNRGAVRRRAGRSLEDLLEELRTGHEAALAFLATVPEESFDRVGRHGSGEWLTVEAYFRRMADHRREHVGDITRALEGARNAS